MESKEIDEKRVMHVDTSCKLYERKDTGIAYLIVESGYHKGLALSLKLKKELERDLDAKHDYARIYAICIFCLIKEDFDKFDILIICGDENFIYVKKYLDLLFQEEKSYLAKRVISISELRELTGKKRLKSKADNVARSYRRRALKSTARQQEGKKLNPIRVNYLLISQKWAEIDKKLRK